MPLFNGGYYVRHLILQDSSLLGRLGQHADWRVDRIFSLARRATNRSSRLVECGSGRRACARSCAARIRQLATLGGIGEIILGLWLIASPFTFGYAEAGSLQYWHFVLGAIILLLATWKLWQDWRLSDKLSTASSRHAFESPGAFSSSAMINAAAQTREMIRSRWRCLPI